MTTPKEFLAALPEIQKKDAIALDKMIRAEAPKLKPVVIPSGMGLFLGYGKYPYKTKAGKTGDWFTIGISSRKQGLSLYICAVENGKYLAEVYKKKLPKADIGKSCIRFKKLTDLDEETLRQLLREAQRLHGSMTH